MDGKTTVTFVPRMEGNVVFRGIATSARIGTFACIAPIHAYSITGADVPICVEAES